MSYFYPEPVNCKRGAPFGRPAKQSPNPSGRFTLQRVRISSEGYDSGGAYWGVGAPLYRYASGDGTAEGYIRAAHRSLAKQAVRKIVPTAQFHR